jgi:hypothetical protein
LEEAEMRVAEALAAAEEARKILKSPPYSDFILEIYQSSI